MFPSPNYFRNFISTQFESSSILQELFEWCVEEDSRSLRLEKLLVELKAGGVSENHQEEVRLTVGSKESWDLIDFLSYLPLFIMTHDSVVNNPLDDSRSK